MKADVGAVKGGGGATIKDASLGQMILLGPIAGSDGEVRCRTTSRVQGIIIYFMSRTCILLTRAVRVKEWAELKTKKSFLEGQASEQHDRWRGNGESICEEPKSRVSH